VAEFPETQWSRLLEMRDREGPRYAERLEELARRYWTPVYHYARALRPGAEAEDLTQQFFAMLLARRDLERLSPERGSFRGFLKTALRNFLASADRAAAARPRPFRFGEAEAVWARSATRDPEEAFEREWAREVMMDAVGRLRGEVDPGLYDLFRELCLADDAPGHEEAARARGWSADDVRNRLRELRARLREILREILRETVGPGGDVEAELRRVLGG
jgi:RNA polymerase sigma-70 factor (ECF subfamily)